jgi:hypothetical protein
LQLPDLAPELLIELKSRGAGADGVQRLDASLLLRRPQPVEHDRQIRLRLAETAFARAMSVNPAAGQATPNLRWAAAISVTVGAADWSGMWMDEFGTFFETATGHRPYGYQARTARDGLPSLVTAPTGAGKTAIILAWLWRRLYGPDPGGTPRRLVYALPQRGLVEQVAGQTREWLANYIGYARDLESAGGPARSRQR